MASEGPNYTGTVADDATVGTIAWANPTNAQTTDDNYATFTSSVSQEVSHYLWCTNFGFSIPVGATVNGIVVEIERKGDNPPGSNIVDSTIKIIKAGAIAGDNKSAGAAWATIESFISFGGAADTWNAGCTVANINASNFGVGISAKHNGPTSISGSVDSVRITVHYTPVAGAPSGMMKKYWGA